ncbi:cellulase family glycosylhydrolase [Amycolatopsis albispora]|uniref:Endoglucanase n=1 Tax=Amycolatopsis albispora TaxID=1804986 RepID=A0A344L2D8_9PSEU|nr:cellulase family glycosylhydrolase [Amycolatopsis albispora]AXB42212.1 beta-mannosidase [Amycolatopsis albispora]
MRKRLALLSVLLAAMAGLAVPAVTAAAPASGFYVQNGRLYESNGAEFVMRGVNHAHTWYRGETSSFANIKALGANTVRVVLSSGHQWTKNDAADVSTVVSLCKQNRLICVLEVHDTTGYGEQAAAVSLDTAANYWLEVKNSIIGQEQYVIVNIGNEPWGNTGYAGWTDATKSAIQKLRAGGLTHTLMVDAPNWGQDWSFTMRDNAASVFAADSLKNTLFSVHMYGVFDTAAEITDYLGRFTAAGLPILVGEFGHNHSDGDPDEDTIFATTQAQRLGYLGWSWSGNGGGVEYLDMATGFNPAALTSWGQRIFNGANGIKQTAREATVFGGDNVDTQAPTTPGTPTASGVTANSVQLSWAASTDNTAVTGYDVVRINGTAEASAVSSSTNAATVTGLSPATAYTFAVYARDAAGNRSARSGTVAVTTAPAGAGACSAGYRVTGQWSGGYQAEVTLTNTGTSAIDGWQLGWTFTGGQTITNLWHGVPVQTGASVVVTNAAYNKVIAAGGSVTIGFTGSWTGSNPAPAAFALNGATCSAA